MRTMNTRLRRISATLASLALVVGGLAACETDDPGTDNPDGGTNPTTMTTVPAGPSSTAMVEPTTTLAG